MKKAKQDYSSRLKERFPEFEKGWTKLVNDVGIDLVNFLKEKLRAEYSFLKEVSQFKFKMVIDNNFILGQIKGVIKKKKGIEHSLLYKLMMSKSIEMFAPPLLKEELDEKIRLLLQGEDQELALSYAMVLLPNITIKDAQWMDSWRMASNLIGDTDKDDIPYLALAFEIGGHGILSRDEVFHKQGDVQVWKHNDAGRVVTSYNSGFISLVLMDQSGQLFGKLIAVVFRFIRDSLLELVDLLVALAAGAIKGIAKIPMPIIIGLALLGIIYFDEIKNTGKDFFKYIVEKGNEILQKLKAALKEIGEILIKALDVVQLGATITFEFLGFLVHEFNRFNDQIADLTINQSYLPIDASGVAKIKMATPRTMG